MHRRIVIVCLLSSIVLLAGVLMWTASHAMAQANPAIVRASGAVLYAQPNGEPLVDLAVGTVVIPTGRSRDQQWIAVQTQGSSGPSRSGWVASADLIGFELEQLAVIESELESVPTATPQEEPTRAAPIATATPSATPQPATTPKTDSSPSVEGELSVLGVTSVQGADLLDAPGGSVLAHLGPGSLLQVSARTGDAAWVRGLNVADPSLRGWISAEQVYLADVAALPVFEPEDGQIAGEQVESADNASSATPASSEPTTTESTEDAQTMNTPAAPAAEAQAIVNSDGDRLNIRSGPGLTYAVTAKAQDGERYVVLARNRDGAWLQIDTTTGYAAQFGTSSGWVSAAFVDYAGDLNSLPILESIGEDGTGTETQIEPAQPAATSTPAPAPQTAPALQTIRFGEDAAQESVDDLAGTLVFQSSPGGMIYGYNLADGALWTLTNGFDPAISPDGQTVTFVRDGGENGVYLIDIDGSNERRIFSGRTRLSSPKWSPDGAWILFTRSDEFTECYGFGPGGCIDQDILDEGFKFSDEISLSHLYDYSLARVDRNGENYRDIEALSSARAADWNEAGIVYQSDAGLQITADVPNAENQLVIYEYLKPFYVDPDWQPDGGRIVYMGKEASHWELFSITPDGQGRMALTRPATALVDEIPSNVAPAWSPDSEHIAFLSNRTDSGEAGAWHLWIMNADGSNQHPLPIDIPINYTFGGEQSISWALATR